MKKEFKDRINNLPKEQKEKLIKELAVKSVMKKITTQDKIKVLDIVHKHLLKKAQNKKD